MTNICSYALQVLSCVSASLRHNYVEQGYSQNEIDSALATLVMGNSQNEGLQTYISR